MEGGCRDNLHAGESDVVEGREDRKSGRNGMYDFFLHFFRLYSSEVSISDDMTGQFSLVPISQELSSKFRRFSNDIIETENGVPISF